jgi:hypothetical protein
MPMINKDGVKFNGSQVMGQSIAIIRMNSCNGDQPDAGDSVPTIVNAQTIIPRPVQT